MAQHQRGKAYVTILTIAVLLVITVTVTVTVVTVLVDNTISYRVTTESDVARYNADACAEVAINKLKENLAYAGANETITLDRGTCTIANISGSGNSNRIITTSGTYNNVVRKLSINVLSVNPSTSISSWTEVDEI